MEKKNESMLLIIGENEALSLLAQKIENNEYGLELQEQEEKEDMETVDSSGQNDERRRIASNRARYAADMPECIRLLSELEEELLGPESQVGEWMRISYELNDDYELAPAEMVQEICGAFMKVNHQYSNNIARVLYENRSIVLPYEIVRAADYLSMGGKLQNLRDLADVGVFMGAYDLIGYDQKTELVAFINNGGSADDVYEIIASEGRCQTIDQAEDGSPTLGSVLNNN